MKTPNFWYSSNPALETILSPLSSLYQNIQEWSFARRAPQSIDVPVISVGNMTAGGSGKTPTAIAISQLIQSENLFLNPFFVTRGYGGYITKPELIDDQTPVLASGDEAKLLAIHAKTIVARNRLEGAIYARDVGADVIILDDGLQNRHLKADLSLCVIDGAYGIGNGKLIPAGPLRESKESAIARTHGVILIGEDKTDVIKTLPHNIPVFRMTLVPDFLSIQKHTTYVAFCGLGIPQKFYKTLSDADINILETQDYADHHQYSALDIEQLITRAKSLSARLITTEKDFVKIKSVYDDTSIIDVVPVSLEFNEAEKFIAFLKERLPLS